MNKAKYTVNPPPVNDQINAKVEVARSERINKSARSNRNHGRPSAATSTRMKNQNQYPPTASISAPICHSCGSRVDVDAAGEKIIIAVATMKIMVPHMVNRWESLRLGLLNSPEVNTSFTSTEAAIDAFSPPPTGRFALFFAFFAFSKKLPPTKIHHSTNLPPLLYLISPNKNWHARYASEK